MELGLSHIKKARNDIVQIIKKTGLEQSNTLSELCETSIYLKTENLQKTGSFKIRGAANKIYNLKEKGGLSGVVAASAGNHAQGVAYASSKYGMPSVIVMPEGAPIVKATATRQYGAEVIIKGKNYDQCYEIAKDICKKDKKEYVHAFDDPYVIAGQGTVGLELLEQLPSLDNIIIPMGGGGLIAGVLLAVKELKPKVRVIGVQIQGSSPIYNKMKKIKSDDKQIKSMADGIMVNKPGQLPMAIIDKYLDDAITVTEEEITRGTLFGLERCKLVIEGAAATTLSALLYNKISNLKGKTVAVLTGGNIDINVISSIIQRGLVEANRVAFLEVVLADVPGELNKLLLNFAQSKANVIKISHNRLSSDVPLNHAKVNVCIETRSKTHLQEIVQTLKKEPFYVKFKNNI
ncbi:threonine ammonia-lyase [Proteinivorax tanatarense]|uniref:L-threonine dehydratase catabolic TdcB n=1 Tax=Proteinivorax tanatarense TaxID=1260629 RepID=A0AAU7VMA0_9FIRM